MPPRPAAAAAAQIQKRLPTKTSSSSSSPKPLITKTSESQNPPKLEISSNHRRQTFDLNEPFYNSSEEIDEVGETAQDKYEIVIKNKNKLNEVDVNESEEEEEEEEEVKEIEEDSKPKKETNKKQKEFEVFVGGIDRDAVEEDLKRVFNKVGEVVEVRLVRSKHSQKNKGFAFVRFATVDQAKRAASELNFTRVRGKVCEVTRNNDNETLHLGNICTTWTKDTLVEKLKSYELENLETVDLIDDPNEKGKNRGYAFLSFSTHMDAVAACSKLQKGHVFFGRTVRGDVAFAKSAVEPDEEVMAQVKSVFLDGLPVSWDEAKVHEQLKKYGEIENVQLAHSMPSARRKDFGFICFRTREAALACIDSVNKNGIGEGAHKVLLRATLRKPLKKRIPLMMGGWRGYSSKSYEHGTGYSYPNRPSRSIQSPGRDHDRRFVSRYSRRGDEYERELSPPVEKYGYHFRRGSVRQVPTRPNAHSRSRDPYFESSSSSRRSLANYQDLPTSYHRIPSHERYVEDIYDPPLDYYEDSTAEDFDYPTSSRLKRPYSYVDDELLVSRSLTRRTRSRWSGLDVDDYPGHDASSYDEYSRNMLDDRISYESPVDASQYLSGSGASRSYYY
ncbi:RNA recognition motif domain [Macleaya cordata]|uniref:RNA recognition motif domain n=1 Tax=Macleaya cordata TaxID=56857 RepID=A0A200QWD6_MACCD|nr:RNA recognition motif domain [Macleaya cordata]